jgi:two-component system, NtrC family, response regulator AtoC
MAQKTAYQAEHARTPQAAGKRDNISILVVDDDALVVDFLQEYLKRSDYRVNSAACGEDAISSLAQTVCDIVLVDLKMPGLDGLQTIEKITEIDPDVVTILMTGFPTIDSSVKAIRLGASDYILKPFRLEEIDLAIKKAAHEREVRQDMKNLRERVSELEQGITENKKQITINHKVGSMASANDKS